MGSLPTPGGSDVWGAQLNRAVPHDRRWVPGASETVIDDFNDDSLDAAWVRVDTSGHSGYVAWTESGDVLSAATGLNTDAAAELHAQMRPLSGAGGSLSAGDGFVTHLTTMTLANYTIAGLVLADGVTAGSGNQVLGSIIASSSLLAARYNLTGYNTQASFTSEATVMPPSVYVRLALISGTNYRLDVSPDGVSWVLGTLVSSAATLTHVGLFASSWSTATKGVASFEFLRRVSGVT